MTGTFAAFFKSLVHHVFEWTGLSVDFYDMVTAYLTHGYHKVENFQEWIFSSFGDMILGVLFGIILGYWLKSSRPEYHWWMGLGYGFGI